MLHLPRIPPIIISENGQTMERLCFDHTPEEYASKYLQINLKKEEEIFKVNNNTMGWLYHLICMQKMASIKRGFFSY